VNDLIVVVQCGDVRLIGVALDPTLGESLRLRDVGAILIQRGIKPGMVQGTVHQVKQVQIAALDFCRGPLKEVTVNNWNFLYDSHTLDEESASDLRRVYEDFLNRKESTIQHQRTGELP
jgi:hypothetical protein